MENKEQEIDEIFLLMKYLQLSLVDIAKMKDYEKDFLIKQLNNKFEFNNK